MGPLAGVTVLDLTQAIAGPYATKLLADHGADVLKIEHPHRGDVSRRMGPFPGDEPHRDRSGMFLELNTSKRSVTLNLKTASGRQILGRLAEQADIVIESFRPGVIERLGLGSARLEELNPRAALVSISSFGAEGPYRDFEVDDMLAYAMGGVLSITAEWGREPLKIGLYAPLFLTGGVIAAFTLGALRGSGTSGRGERVEMSLHDILATSMDRGGTNLAAYEYSGSLFFERQESQRTTALPSGVYPCMDGYVHVICGPRWWDRFCRMIDRPDLIEDETLVPHLLDFEYAAAVDGLFYPWLLERTKQQIMERGQAEGLPVSAINTTEDVANDPHLRERGFFQRLEMPGAGTVDLPGFPFRMLGTPGEMRRAPMLGEHTLEVLTERLGYSKEDVVLLRQRDVV
ncbi:MAG: CoA transferase [Chloroflexi bacterium]|nr:CoA transferase [Chloroflexota bacterium]